MFAVVVLDLHVFLVQLPQAGVAEPHSVLVRVYRLVFLVVAQRFLVLKIATQRRVLIIPHRDTSVNIIPDDMSNFEQKAVPSARIKDGGQRKLGISQKFTPIGSHK